MWAVETKHGDRYFNRTGLAAGVLWGQSRDQRGASREGITNEGAVLLSLRGFKAPCFTIVSHFLTVTW